MNNIPYLNMKAEVNISGGPQEPVTFKNVSSIEITDNLKELSSTATIVLPRFYQKLNNKSPLDYISPGRKVTIKFGYEETNTSDTVEFEGFVKEIGSETPLQITCDQLYPLRQNHRARSYRAADLRQVLTYITTETFIKEIKCPEVPLGKYVVENTSTYQELNKLKERFGFFSKVKGNTLTVGFAYDWDLKSTHHHTYNIQANVRQSDLTYKREKDFNVRLRVNILNGKGEDAFRERGSKDATVQTLEYSATDIAQANKILDSRYKQNLYDGYTGSITGFGFPTTNAGDSLTIIDSSDASRNGTYLIEKVVKSYSSGGISRKNELAFRVS